MGDLRFVPSDDLEERFPRVPSRKPSSLGSGRASQPFASSANMLEMPRNSKLVFVLTASPSRRCTRAIRSHSVMPSVDVAVKVYTQVAELVRVCGGDVVSSGRE